MVSRFRLNQLIPVALLCAVPAASLQLEQHELQLESELAAPLEQPAGPASEFASRAEEKYIYEKHWQPLAPPPYHHPGIEPNRTELASAQALEANYTSYWRRLPRYPQASQRLKLAEQAPYFKIAWRTAEGHWKLPSGPMFVIHHKTGQNLHNNIANALKSATKFIDIYEPLPAQCPQEGARLIHLVRHPVNMIVSGYRYHQNRWGSEVWSWGHGKRQDPQCFECDDDDHAAMFETCAFNCTYFELLNRVDEATGISIEAISARRSVTSMANMLALCRHRPNVLHLSFDLLRANYQQSAACILRFLGLEGLEGSGLQHKLVEGMQRIVDFDHVTSGVFENRFVRERLQKNPTWGPDFAAVDALMADAFSYQADAHGCPERESQQP